MKDDYSVNDVPVVRIEPPSFDVSIGNPFSVKIEELKVDLRGFNIKVEVKLPEVLKTDVPSINVDNLFRIVSPDLLRYGKSSFDDITTTPPIIQDKVFTIGGEGVSRISSVIREAKLKRVALTTEASAISINIPQYGLIELSEVTKGRYTIRIKLGKQFTPEIKDIIEERLTKEFKITRIMKRMEIVENERDLLELEFLMKSFMKKLKRFESSHKAL